MNRVKSINAVFLATVAISVIGSELLGLVSNYIDNYIIILLLSQGLLILPMLGYILKYKLSIRKTIRFQKINLSNIILLVIFAYLIMPLMTLISLISQLFATSTITDSITTIVSDNSLIWSLFAIAFIPCILEESVYRGVFYNEYRKINPRKGIVLSAFLFGLMHMNFNQFSYAFAMGVVFTLLIEATDSIVSSMIVHFVINANSVILSYVGPKLNKIVNNMDTTKDMIQDTSVTKDTILQMIGAYFFIALITTVLAFLVFKAIAKNENRYDYVKSIFKKSQKIENNSLSNGYEYEIGLNQMNEPIVSSSNIIRKKEKLISIPLIAGILWCIAIMIMTEIFERL